MYRSWKMRTTWPASTQTMRTTPTRPTIAVFSSTSPVTTPCPTEALLEPGDRHGPNSTTTLLAEKDLDYVAVLDDVSLALGAKLAVLARLRHGLEREEILVRDHFGADEAARQVRVDRAGSFHGRRTVRNGPGSDFVRSGGQEREQPEQLIAELDHSAQA